MQIGLTEIVKKRVKNSDLLPAEGEDLAFCWDAHLIKARNRNVLLVVNASSRYGIAMTDKEPSNWNYFSLYINRVIYFALAAEGYSEEQISKYFLLAGNFILTKTHGKKAVGGINRISIYVDCFGKPLYKDTKYQREISEYINHDICCPPGFEEYGLPDELFYRDMQRLGVVGKKRPTKVIDFMKYKKDRDE
jgi:hypothetical protein